MTKRLLFPIYFVTINSAYSKYLLFVYPCFTYGFSLKNSNATLDTFSGVIVS